MYPNLSEVGSITGKYQDLCAVISLDLNVCLQIIGSGCQPLSPQEKTYRWERFADKLGAVISQ